MEKFTINMSPEKVFEACKDINNFLKKGEKEKITVSKDGKTAKASIPIVLGISKNVNIKLTNFDDDKIIRISCQELGIVLAGKVSETIQGGNRASEVKLVIEKCRPDIPILGSKIVEMAPKLLAEFSNELAKRLKEMKDK